MSDRAATPAAPATISNPLLLHWGLSLPGDAEKRCLPGWEPSSNQGLESLQTCAINSTSSLSKRCSAREAATSGRLGHIQRRLLGLNRFRALAQDNGIDQERFINSLGTDL